MSLLHIPEDWLTQGLPLGRSVQGRALWGCDDMAAAESLLCWILCHESWSHRQGPTPEKRNANNLQNKKNYSFIQF